MATRTGYLASVGISGQVTPGLSADLSRYENDYWPPHAADDALTQAGSRSASLPVASHAVGRDGCVTPSYFDDYYNRIHVIPKAIDLGNISPPQVRFVEVWNAFMEPKPLTGISAVGTADGLTFSPAPPMTFQPLQSVVFTLTAGADAAPTVDVVFTFEFTGVSGATLAVVGVSVIPMPWPQMIPMSETLTWLTDIMTARDGTEQRVSLRDTPRQVYLLSVHTADFTGAQHAFVGGYGRSFAVPSMGEGKPCTVGAGATEIVIDTRSGDWREMVMIWSSETSFEVIEIASVLPDRLLLRRPVIVSRKGRAYPTATARLIADPVRTSYGRAGMIQATVQFINGRDLASAAPALQWSGYDVLLQAPMLNPVDDTMGQRIEVLDNGTSWDIQDRYWSRAKVARPMRWVVNKGGLWRLRGWLHRRRGATLPFYHPSFEPDFQTVGAGAVGNTLQVKANGYEKHGKTKALAITTTTGAWVFADIASVTDGGLGSISLNLGQSLTINYNQIRRISLMGLKRLATDTVQINWLGGEVAEVLTDFLELQ